ncbi:MAG: pilus assembly protein CpaB, partial [Actinomycetota bacterium]|nr:pilus assembly protein CpaB [Actinomycetota bacterium]
TGMRPLLLRLRRVRRRVLRHRRSLAAVTAALTAYVGVQAMSAPPPPRQLAWTASHDLDGGTVLARVDLRRVGFAPGSIPAHALTDPDQLVGRTLTAPVRQGQALTDRSVLGPGALAGYPQRTGVPVRITDPDVVALLHPGDRVCLVSADPQGRDESVLLAPDVPVVTIPDRSTPGLSTALPGRLVVVAVPSGEAQSVASASASRMITVMWGC